MEKVTVTVSRKWKEREIKTFISGSVEGIEIAMPLTEFVEVIASIAVEKLPIMSTRSQVRKRILEAVTEAVSQMKENTRQALSK